jgi:hypothetical protein
MKATLVSFGVIEIDGRKYEHDVIIDRGRVRKRRKGPSKSFRDEYGHTPVSMAEAIPWSGSRLIIGTGAHGDLPVMDEVYEEARRRGVRITAEPTAKACSRLAAADDDKIAAILHVTC